MNFALHRFIPIERISYRLRQVPENTKPTENIGIHQEENNNNFHAEVAFISFTQF